MQDLEERIDIMDTIVEILNIEYKTDNRQKYEKEQRDKKLACTRF